MGAPLAAGNLGALLHPHRVPEQLMRFDTVCEERWPLAERGHEPVLFGHRERAPDLGGLLADGRRVRADLPAPLQRDGPLVEATRALHLLVQF